MKTLRNSILICLIISFCLAIVSCGNSADRKQAENFALGAVDSYYEKNYEYRSYSGGFICNHKSTVSNISYSGGNYIVTIDLEVIGKPADSIEEIPFFTEVITYTLKVKDGSVKQIDVNYQ
ncbi:MAG: hypothetical protein IJM71_03620 [Clostridia bacterium]|nr:hypothetical protein [Clostridia bacterium]